jgi:DNA phosphorothioation-dependent restriction protein DptG
LKVSIYLIMIDILYSLEIYSVHYKFAHALVILLGNVYGRERDTLPAQELFSRFRKRVDAL